MVVIGLVMSLVAVLQIALLPALNMTATLNLILVVLILSVFVSSRRDAIFGAMILAMIFEAWSFWPFGSWLIILNLITVLAALAVDNFFTNKSLYSYLLLIAVSSLVFELYWLVVASWPAPIVINSELTVLALQKSAINMLAGLVLFYLAVGLSNSFQSVILVKKKY